MFGDRRFNEFTVGAGIDATMMSLGGTRPKMGRISQDVPENGDRGSPMAQVFLKSLHKIPPNVEQSITYGKGTADKLIPICAPKEEMYHLGPSMALYFEFMKLCIILFTFLFLETGIFSTISNFVSNDEPSSILSIFTSSLKQSTLDFLTKSSWINKLSKTDLVNAQAWVNFGAVFIAIVVLHCHRRRQRRLILAVDQSEIEPSDYTIRLRKVPKDATDEEIVDWVSKLLPNQDLEVKELIRTHKIGKLVRLLRRRKRLDAMKLNAKSWKEKTKCTRERTALDDKLRDLIHKDLDYTDVVFVSFEKSMHCKMIARTYKQKFIQKKFGKLFKRPQCCYQGQQYFKGKFIPIDRAPEPTDVAWENLGYSHKKWKRRGLTNLLIFVMITITFGILFALKIAQTYIDQYLDTSPAQLFLSAANVLIVLLINSFLSIGIRKSQSLEKTTTYTKFFVRVATMLSVAQFVNSTFMILLANIAASIIKGNNIIVDLQTYKNSGLMWDVFFLFLAKIIGPVTSSIINPNYLMLLLKRWKIKRATQKNRPIKLTQAYCNTVFENPPFDLTYSYSSAVSNAWFAAFYLPLFPLGYLLVIVGYIMLYWAKKVELLRASSYPRCRLGSKLNTRMIDLLDNTCLSYSVGCLFWGWFLNNGEVRSFQEVLAYFLSFAITLCHVALPQDLLNRAVFKVDNFAVSEPSYSVAKREFSTNYQIENPLTRDEALMSGSRIMYEKNPKFKQYFDELLQNHLLDFGEKMLQQPKEKRGWNRRSTKKKVTLRLLNDINMYSATKVGIEELATPFEENLNSQTSVRAFVLNLHRKSRQKREFQESHFAVALDDFSPVEIQQINDTQNPFPKSHFITRSMGRKIVKTFVEPRDLESIIKEHSKTIRSAEQSPRVQNKSSPPRGIKIARHSAYANKLLTIHERTREDTMAVFDSSANSPPKKKNNKHGSFIVNGAVQHWKEVEPADPESKDPSRSDEGEEDGSNENEEERSDKTNENHSPIPNHSFSDATPKMLLPTHLLSVIPITKQLEDVLETAKPNEDGTIKSTRHFEFFKQMNLDSLIDRFIEESPLDKVFSPANMKKFISKRIAEKKKEEVKRVEGADDDVFGTDFFIDLCGMPDNTVRFTHSNLQPREALNAIEEADEEDVHNLREAGLKLINQAATKNLAMDILMKTQVEEL